MVPISRSVEKSDTNWRQAMVESVSPFTGVGRAEILRRFPEALAQGKLSTYFVPITGMADGCVKGYEVLAGWIQPGGTAVEATEFVPHLESTSLVGGLDSELVKQALDALKVLP